MIVDAQTHTWVEDSERHPWDRRVGTAWHFEEASMPYATLVEEMDAVGVDAALLVVPRVYGWDNGYALEAASAFPDRLAVLGRVDPRAPDVDRRLRALLDRPGFLGVRISLQDPGALLRGDFDALFEAARRLESPVSIYPRPAGLRALGTTARRFDGLRFVVDHLGMEAPPTVVPAPGPEPFARLSELLELAELPNVSVKLTATPALSNEPFPFRDVWPAVHSVISTFGPERVMWGADFTRTATLHSYAEALRYVYEIDGLGEDVVAQILGATARSVYRWNPASP